MIYVGKFLGFGFRFIWLTSGRLFFFFERKQFLRQPRALKDVSILSPVKVVFVNGQELLLSLLCVLNSARNGQLSDQLLHLPVGPSSSSQSSRRHQLTF